MKNSLIIENLFIFDTSEKKAKSISFSEKRNIVTSSKDDGNKKGKSVLLKSIYHTLGADCSFDDKWDNSTKIFILKFKIKNKKYYIFRHEKLFKIFDNDFNLLRKTSNRTEVSLFLSELYNFKIELPNRVTEKLEITPPAYSYLLTYLDQDKMDGTNFNSFENLGQYKDYKENVLYGHFGIFNNDYYELMKKITFLLEEKKKYIEEQDVLDKMLSRIDASIGGTSYNKNIESLQREVDKTKKEYSIIIKSMNSSRKKLIDLKNVKYDTEISLEELQQAIKSKNSELNNFKNHICPTCNSQIFDSLDYKYKKYNTIEDYLILSSVLETEITKLENSIQKEEEQYKEIVKKLNKYNEKLNLDSKDIDDVIKHKGLIDVQEEVLKDYSIVANKINEIDNLLKNEEKCKKKYSDLKGQVNKYYKDLMLADKNKFNLKEIDEERFETIKNTFKAGGSNKPISTIIWYFNLNKIKNEFNPEAIKFPLVLDSPNNVELDRTNKNQLFKYLFESVDENTQLIVSTLGFDKSILNNPEEYKIIQLDNEKYELLNEYDYKKYYEILEKLIQRK